MPSSYSARLRLNLQASGENQNTWGQLLNSGVFSLVDFSIAGFTTKAITGNVTLSSANGSTDEARAAVLKFTGTTAATITIPSVEKTYFVWNAASADQTITTGAGDAAAIGSGQVTLIVCDGTNVRQLGVDGDSFKDYVDAQAFAALNGDLPAQSGNANKFLFTNGTATSWASTSVALLSDFPAQTGNANEFLTTDGTSLSWVARATTAETRQAATKLVDAAALFAAAESVSLTDGATITPNGNDGWNFHVTLGGNRALANPSNFKAGQSGRFRIVQDATGSRTLSFGTAWAFPGGSPTLSTAANAIDVITYFVHDASAADGIECRLSRAFS